MKLFETTLRELYQSTVEAFPETTKRQYATNEIVIMKLEWVPFLTMKTLRVKGFARNKENGNEYNPVILFKQVAYHPQREIGVIEIIDNIGKTYFLEKLNEEVQVLVRCNCNDMKFRGLLTDRLDGCLIGNIGQRTKNSQGIANPTNAPMICKHLMVLSHVLHAARLIE